MGAYTLEPFECGYLPLIVYVVRTPFQRKLKESDPSSENPEPYTLQRCAVERTWHMIDSQDAGLDFQGKVLYMFWVFPTSLGSRRFRF